MPTEATARSDSLRVVFDSVSVLGEKNGGSGRKSGGLENLQLPSRLEERSVSKCSGAKSIVLDYKNRYYAISERPIPDGPNSARYGQARRSRGSGSLWKQHVFLRIDVRERKSSSISTRAAGESAVDPSIVAAAGFAQTGPAKQPYCKSVSFEVGGHGLTMKNIRVKRISPRE